MEVVKIKGMRNRIAHGYFDLQIEVIYKTVVTELPLLKEQLWHPPAIRPGLIVLPNLLPIHPLTKPAFAPYGDVIEADPSTMRLINGGTTERFMRWRPLRHSAKGASVILNIFRGQPRAFPYSVTMMERHPFGSQSFSPLSGRPFLVVVAEDDGGKPGVPQVFWAGAHQGVNYRANVWHHPLMSLKEISDFLVVDRTGPGNNLENISIPNPSSSRSPKHDRPHYPCSRHSARQAGGGLTIDLFKLEAHGPVRIKSVVTNSDGRVDGGPDADW